MNFFDYIKFSISQFQIGCLENHSCLRQLLIFLDNILESFHDNTQVDTVYLDFCKAFDKVPHLELLAKLSNIGIFVNLVTLVCLVDILSSFKIILQKAISLNKHFKSLVLTASFRSTTMIFLMFVICKVFVFADNTKYYKAIKTSSNCDQLQTS